MSIDPGEMTAEEALYLLELPQDADQEAIVRSLQMRLAEARQRHADAPSTTLRDMHAEELRELELAGNALLGVGDTSMLATSLTLEEACFLLGFASVEAANDVDLDRHGDVIASDLRRRLRGAPAGILRDRLAFDLEQIDNARQVLQAELKMRIAAREEAARAARELAERQAREEAERAARELAERQVREEAERAARELAERQAREEAERAARELAERQVREEAERVARELAEWQAREEAERAARELAEWEARLDAGLDSGSARENEDRESGGPDAIATLQLPRVNAEHREKSPEYPTAGVSMPPEEDTWRMVLPTSGVATVIRAGLADGDETGEFVLPEAGVDSLAVAEEAGRSPRRFRPRWILVPSLAAGVLLLAILGVAMHWKDQSSVSVADQADASGDTASSSSTDGEALVVVAARDFRRIEERMSGAERAAMEATAVVSALEGDLATAKGDVRRFLDKRLSQARANAARLTAIKDAYVGHALSMETRAGLASEVRALASTESGDAVLLRGLVSRIDVVARDMDAVDAAYEALDELDAAGRAPPVPNTANALDTAALKAVAAEVRARIEAGEFGAARAAALSALDGHAVPAPAELDLLPVEERIVELLRLGEEAIGRARLQFPKGDNAFEYYQRVLALQPDHAQASEGILRIARRYVVLAEQALDSNQADRAEEFLARAEQIDSAVPKVDTLRERIASMREAAAQADLATARQAVLDAMKKDDLGAARTLLADLGRLGEPEASMIALGERLRAASVRPGRVFSDALSLGGTGPRVVIIPAGSLRMGVKRGLAGMIPGTRARAESPQHDVRIAGDFAAGVTEITRAQFGRFVEATGYRTSTEKGGFSARSREDRKVSSGGVWSSDGTANLPVRHVSWRDAEAYVEWLSRETGKRYTLPSEAQFEYLLRAGSEARMPWGDAAPAGAVGNLAGGIEFRGSSPGLLRDYSDGHPELAPVGSFAANRFGVRDLVGNVAEWVADCWHANYNGAPTDGRAWLTGGDCSRRVVRGSSWQSGEDSLHSSYRDSWSADSSAADLGFRVMRVLEREE